MLVYSQSTRTYIMICICCSYILLSMYQNGTYYSYNDCNEEGGRSGMLLFIPYATAKTSMNTNGTFTLIIWLDGWTTSVEIIWWPNQVVQTTEHDLFNLILINRIDITSACTLVNCNQNQILSTYMSRPLVLKGWAFSSLYSVIW